MKGAFKSECLVLFFFVSTTNSATEECLVQFINNSKNLVHMKIIFFALVVVVVQDLFFIDVFKVITLMGAAVALSVLFLVCTLLICTVVLLVVVCTLLICTIVLVCLAAAIVGRLAVFSVVDVGGRAGRLASRLVPVALVVTVTIITVIIVV